MSPPVLDLRPPEREALPLLVSVPHCGTGIPLELEPRLDPEVLRDLPDTDWHLQRLYDFVPALGGTLLTARFSRYVIDLNRDPESRPLYPGRFETGLCPTETFDRRPLYREGQAPDAGEIAERRARYWQPYHDRLAEELAALKERFGFVCLFEAHSIKAEVPALFEGTLPECVVGDAAGAACAPERSEDFREALVAAGRQVAHNQPFRGGYITRHFGDPEGGVHALQLEMRTSNYLLEEAAPWPYDEGRAKILRAHLGAALTAFVSA
ncbi:MAG: N-formylglutamate deformylase [Deltaproteobacteria bacterium]|nr:N-formylglutamate deformylase [Deltaproteobacteria bacterium]